MSSTVTNYIQPLTQPLEGLYNSFTQMASQHRDMNDRFRSHKDDLLSNVTFTFQGSGADAFANLVDYYLNTSEKHMQAFDNAAGAVQTCHSTITAASSTADAAGLHEGLTNQVLGQVSHNDIIQRGSDPIQTVVSDMQRTLSDMAGTAGDMFTNLLHFHFGTAYDDLLKEGGDVKQMVGDLMNLLQDIWRVLSHWAETVWSAVQKCLPAIWSAAQNVMKFVSPYVSWINNALGVVEKFVPKDLGEMLDKAGKILPFIGVVINVLDGTDNTPKKFFSDIIGNVLSTFVPGVDVVALVLGVTSDVFQIMGGAQQNLIAPWIAGNNTTLEQELSAPGSRLSTDAQGIDPGAVFTDLGDVAYDLNPGLRGLSAGWQFIQNPQEYINDPNKLEQLDLSMLPDPGAALGDLKNAGAGTADIGLSLMESGSDITNIGIDNNAVTFGNIMGKPDRGQQIVEDWNEAGVQTHQEEESWKQWVNANL